VAEELHAQRGAPVVADGVAGADGDERADLERRPQPVEVAAGDKQTATVTFVWMQGERDAKEKHGEVYAKSLKGLIQQLSDDLKRKDINFVIGRLSDFSNDNKKYPHWTIVRKAQVEVGESGPRGAWVDTDDLNGDKDGLHYTKAGYKELGTRFAKKSIELVKKHVK